MSHVTDILILSDSDEDDGIAYINEYFDHPFIVKMETSIGGSEGKFGSAANQFKLYGGSVKFINIPDFITYFINTGNLSAWEDRDSIQLMIKDENDDRFTVYWYDDSQLGVTSND